jgi:hypothetical protein
MMIRVEAILEKSLKNNRQKNSCCARKSWASPTNWTVFLITTRRGINEKRGERALLCACPKP